jgi:5-methylcytosine-specific restriction endonuclease McrA
LPGESRWHLYKRQSPAGSGWAWQRIKARVLRRDPLCRICGARPSVQVDHILNRARGGTDHEDNLRGVCVACHRRKTTAESALAQRARNHPRPAMHVVPVRRSPPAAKSATDWSEPYEHWKQRQRPPEAHPGGWSVRSW